MEILKVWMDVIHCIKHTHSRQLHLITINVIKQYTTQYNTEVYKHYLLICNNNKYTWFSTMDIGDGSLSGTPLKKLGAPIVLLSLYTAVHCLAHTCTCTHVYLHTCTRTHTQHLNSPTWQKDELVKMSRKNSLHASSWVGHEKNVVSPIPQKSDSWFPVAFQGHVSIMVVSEGACSWSRSLGAVSQCFPVPLRELWLRARPLRLWELDDNIYGKIKEKQHQRGSDEWTFSLSSFISQHTPYL